MAIIDITGLDKAEVLAKLYNASRPMGFGMLQARGDITVEGARALLDDPLPTNDLGFPRRVAYFDYLFGRPLKIDLRTDRLFVGLYDRDNGQGAASRALGLPMIDPTAVETVGETVTATEEG